jgi:hypothetical protein
MLDALPQFFGFLELAFFLDGLKQRVVALEDDSPNTSLHAPLEHVRDHVPYLALDRRQLGGAASLASAMTALLASICVLQRVIPAVTTASSFELATRSGLCYRSAAQRI